MITIAVAVVEMTVAVVEMMMIIIIRIMLTMMKEAVMIKITTRIRMILKIQSL